MYYSSSESVEGGLTGKVGCAVGLMLSFGRTCFLAGDNTGEGDTGPLRDDSSRVA